MNTMACIDCGRTQGRSLSRRLCIRCYQRHAKDGTINNYRTVFACGSLAERLEQHYIPEPNSGCFLWLGCFSRFGYGRINVGGHIVLAHRFAWETIVGQIPDGLWVLHRCDNPACVNVGHLFLGTHKDNMADCVKKGRQKRGEWQPGAKLSAADVVLIRSSDKHHRQLARELGINETTVRDVIAGRTWRHVRAA